MSNLLILIVGRKLIHTVFWNIICASSILVPPCHERLYVNSELDDWLYTYHFTLAQIINSVFQTKKRHFSSDFKLKVTHLEPFL